jgi:DNA invertase Pin-like site-specific DNA recombinase
MAAGGLVLGASFCAYYRVSTDQQGRSGLGLEAQKASVASHIASVGGRLIAEFEEVESGKRSDRSQLAAALATCRAKRAVLIVAKLDRLTRNTAFLLSLSEGAGEGGVIFCDLPQIPAGPLGKFFLTLMAAVAELEAGLISQRTKAALAAAKVRGVKLGTQNNLRKGGRLASLAGRRTQSARSRQRAKDVMPFITAAQRAGCVSLREIAAALTARGINPPSGGAIWHPAQVSRAIDISKHTVDLPGNFPP